MIEGGCHFVKNKITKNLKRKHVIKTSETLCNESNKQDTFQVLWAQQLFRKTRVKRDFFFEEDRQGSDGPIPNLIPLPSLGLSEKWSRKILPRRSLSRDSNDDDTRGIPSKTILFFSTLKFLFFIFSKFLKFF
jgi:hypothetical protein